LGALVAGGVGAQAGDGIRPADLPQQGGNLAETGSHRAGVHAGGGAPVGVAAEPSAILLVVGIAVAVDGAAADDGEVDAGAGLFCFSPENLVSKQRHAGHGGPAPHRDGGEGPGDRAGRPGAGSHAGFLRHEGGGLSAADGGAVAGCGGDIGGAGAQDATDGGGARHQPTGGIAEHAGRAAEAAGGAE